MPLKPYRWNDDEGKRKFREKTSSPKIKIDVISTSVPNNNPELANPSQEKLKNPTSNKENLDLFKKAKVFLNLQKQKVFIIKNIKNLT